VKLFNGSESEAVDTVTINGITMPLKKYLGEEERREIREEVATAFRADLIEKGKSRPRSGLPAVLPDYVKRHGRAEIKDITHLRRVWGMAGKGIAEQMLVALRKAAEMDSVNRSMDTDAMYKIIPTTRASIQAQGSLLARAISQYFLRHHINGKLTYSLTEAALTTPVENLLEAYKAGASKIRNAVRTGTHSETPPEGVSERFKAAWLAKRKITALIHQSMEAKQISYTKARRELLDEGILKPPTGTHPKTKEAPTVVAKTKEPVVETPVEPAKKPEPASRGKKPEPDVVARGLIEELKAENEYLAQQLKQVQLQLATMRQEEQMRQEQGAQTQPTQTTTKIVVEVRFGLAKD
jgi:hypothetical protein